jgi:hypothetical protein
VDVVFAGEKCGSQECEPSYTRDFSRISRDTEQFRSGGVIVACIKDFSLSPTEASALCYALMPFETPRTLFECQVPDRRESPPNIGPFQDNSLVVEARFLNNGTEHLRILVPLKLPLWFTKALGVESGHPQNVHDREHTR